LTHNQIITMLIFCMQTIEEVHIQTTINLDAKSHSLKKCNINSTDSFERTKTKLDVYLHRRIRLMVE